jgi:hypothetical protein
VCKKLCCLYNFWSTNMHFGTTANNQKAKQNVFKFLNTKNLLLFKQCKKKVLQLHLCILAFPISHWLWINHKFIYNHIFLQSCKQVNFNCSSNSINNHCSSDVGLYTADKTSVAFIVVAKMNTKTWLSGYSTYGSCQHEQLLHTPPTQHHVFSLLKPHFYTTTQ